MANKSIEINDEFIEKLGKQIENNQAPWQRPWEVGELYFPHNMASGKKYNGLNALKLLEIATENSDPRFLTMKQANALGLNVKKGMHGTKISYITTQEITEVKNEITGEMEKVEIPLEKPVIRSYVVFNGSQIDGLKPFEHNEDIKLHDFKPLEAAQQILDSVDIEIIHKKQNHAFYSQRNDTITLPLKEQFKTPEEYYRTAFHEVAHATGAKTRLNRDMTGKFGSNKYAKEELVAEISSFLIGGACQLGFEPHSNSLAYLKAWSKGIKEDPNFLKDAIKQAEQVKNLVLGNYFESLEKARENSYNELVQDHENKTIYVKIDKESYKTNKDLVKNEYGGKWDRNEEVWVFDSSKVSEEQLSKIGTIITKNKEQTKSKENEISLDNSDTENKISNTKEKTESLDKSNNKEAFFKDLTVKFAWSEKDFGIKDDTILKGEEAYKFLDKLVKSDNEQHKIQERIKNGEDIDGLYYYKTSFEVNYKSNNSDFVRVDLGDLEFGGNEKVSDALDYRRTMFSETLIPENEIQSFKKEEERYLQHLEQNISKENDVTIEKTESLKKQEEKIYIDVEYKQKEQAKELGAKWDRNAKSWYCKQADKDKFTKWHVENQPVLQNKYDNPEEKLLGELKKIGVTDNSIICDGKSHRIAVDGDKGKEKSGFYVAHVDGVPNFYFYNNRTGEEFRFVDKSANLTEEDRDKHNAIVKANQIKREQEQKENREKAEIKLKDLYAGAGSVEKNEYLERKNIEASNNVKITKNNDLMIPIYDVDQNLKSAQYIKADGFKTFAKDCNYQGNFHVIDGEFDKLDNCNTIIVTEGYATAKTIHEALRKNGEMDIPVVAAMSVNNMGKVIESIEKKYPFDQFKPDDKKEFVIAADNDMSKKQNIGLETAKKLCENNDNVYITPKKQGKEFDGDFNDLVSKTNDSKDYSKEKALKEIFKNIQSKVNEKQNRITVKLPVKKELEGIIEQRDVRFM